MKYFLIIILIPFSLLLFGSARAISLKVSPAELKINSQTNVSVQKEIEVTNPDNNVALFEVYPDSFSGTIKVRPESFVLEGGQSKKVLLTIKSREIGVFSTHLSVVAKTLGEQIIRANSGVKIPLQIVVRKKDNYPLALLANFWQGNFISLALFFLMAVALLFFIWLFFKKKSSKI
jgi:uncharacterized protein (DUF58 family)